MAEYSLPLNVLTGGEEMNRELQRRQREEQVEMGRMLLRTVEGRAFFCMLIEEGGLTARSQVPGDPNGTDFNEGRRSMARWGYDWVLTCDPEAYILMMREMADRRQSWAAEYRANQPEEDDV